MWFVKETVREGVGLGVGGSEVGEAGELPPRIWEYIGEGPSFGPKFGPKFEPGGEGRTNELLKVQIKVEGRDGRVRETYGKSNVNY